MKSVFTTSAGVTNTGYFMGNYYEVTNEIATKYVISDGQIIKYQATPYVAPSYVPICQVKDIVEL